MFSSPSPRSSSGGGMRSLGLGGGLSRRRIKENSLDLQEPPSRSPSPPLDPREESYSPDE